MKITKTKDGRKQVTEDVFNKIKSALFSGIKKATIAKEFGMHPTTISNIAKHETWADHKAYCKNLRDIWYAKYAKNGAKKNEQQPLFKKEPAKFVESCKHFWVESRFLQGQFFCARCLDQTQVKKLMPVWTIKNGVAVLPIEKPATEESFLNILSKKYTGTLPDNVTSTTENK